MCELSGEEDMTPGVGVASIPFSAGAPGAYSSELPGEQAAKTYNPMKITENE